MYRNNGKLARGNAKETPEEIADAAAKIVSSSIKAYIIK